MSSPKVDWVNLTERASFASHRLIGWIYWDPTAQQNLADLGVPNGLGHYVAYRGAPLASAGTAAVVAAFYTIKSELVEFALNHSAPHATWLEIHQARDAAVLTGIRKLAPEIEIPLASMAQELWRTADSLSSSGRVLFAAHRQWPRPEDQFLSAWNAVNTLREWRGDTHMSLLVSEEIGPVEAGLLHDAWMGYPNQWIPKSRGANDTEIATALHHLRARGLANDNAVNQAGIDFRQHLEDRTNEICQIVWRTLGADQTLRFIETIEPVSERFLRHIDETAGDFWMPAARARRL